MGRGKPKCDASTVKIIVAIEDARQASEGIINPNETVSTKELNTFFIPKTDGGAHEGWIKHLTNSGIDLQHIPLSEVAKGMISYSSNANTEYLMSLLGLDHIEHLLQSLHVANHDSLYPIVSALFIPEHLKKERNLSKKELVAVLNRMEMEEYRRLAIDIHNSWLKQPLTEQEKKLLLKDLNMDIQRIWSDRLPGATAQDYVSIMRKLNNKSYFEQRVYDYLDPVMEQLMENPSNRQWLVHAGQKGGSTAFVLTNSMYATDKEGNETELAFFSNDLTSFEQAKLSKNLHGFQLKFLTDEDFRAQVKRELE
ncbi:serine hydrolase [Bacillus salitolerans]|uniref:Serine hydrolase n=1 Tax=Bacillus salitolerans TaxID=1437434 RepID=A0ABW4LYT6_9BACI